MATRTFIAALPSIAQVETLTPGGTIVVGNTFTVTCNGQSVVYTATDTTAASVSAGLAAALTASTIGEFGDMTWSDATGTVTGTANIEGQPFTVTVSKAIGSGGTNLHSFSRSTTTASSSPNSLTAANWDGTPASNDTLIIENLRGDILYDLDALSALTGITLIVRNFSGSIGLPEYNSSDYNEYRPTYLVCGITSLQYESSGSLGKIDFSDPGGAATATVTQTGSSGIAGLESLLLKGGTSAHRVSLYTNRGSVGVAVLAGETAYIGTALVGYQTGQDSDANVRYGTGVNFSAGYTVTGGKVTSNSDVTDIVAQAGTVTVQAGAVSGTLTNQAATVVLNTTGLVALYDGFGSDTLDLRQRVTKVVVTDMKLRKGSRIQGRLITNTNPIQCLACAASDVALPDKKNVTVAIVEV